MPSLPKPNLPNPRDSLPIFFRQTGQGRDNLPNSANCPIFVEYTASTRERLSIFTKISISESIHASISAARVDRATRCNLKLLHDRMLTFLDSMFTKSTRNPPCVYFCGYSIRRVTSRVRPHEASKPPSSQYDHSIPKNIVLILILLHLK